MSKVNLTDAYIIVSVAPDAKIFGINMGLTVRLPKGYPAVLLNSLRYKDLRHRIVAT